MIPTEDGPTMYLSAAQQYVHLAAQQAETEAELDAAEKELGRIRGELQEVTSCLRGAVNDATGGERAFRVASIPDLIVVVQWFPGNLTTVRAMKLVSPT